MEIKTLTGFHPRRLTPFVAFPTFATWQGPTTLSAHASMPRGPLKQEYGRSSSVKGNGSALSPHPVSSLRSELRLQKQPLT